MACCSDRDLRGDYSIALPVVLERGHNGVGTGWGISRTQSSPLRRFPALATRAPLHRPKCAPLCIIVPEVPPSGSSFFWVSKDLQEVQMPDLWKIGISYKCVCSDNKEQADGQSPPLYAAGQPGQSWPPNGAMWWLRCPCDLRLRAEVPLCSAMVGPWLEPLSWSKPHVLKWARTSRGISRGGAQIPG